jgi:hypothetical protein
MPRIRTLAAAICSLLLLAGAALAGSAGSRPAAVAAVDLPDSADPPATEPPPPSEPPTTEAAPGTTASRPRSAARPPRAPRAGRSAPATSALAPVLPTHPTTAPATTPGAAPTVTVPTAALAAPGPAGAGRFGGIVVAAGRPAQQVHNLDLARVRDTGLTTAAIAVFMDVDALTQSTVRPGPATISDGDLLATMQQARANGLRPVVSLLVQCTGCANPWRGALAPTDTAAFFASYRDAAAHYADLARQGGAALFVAASEMSSLQRHADEWRRVLAVARSRFGGPVTYGANWDAIEGVGFWDAVDVAAVSAYFPLSDAEHPRYDELVAAWHGSRMRNFAGRNWFAELEALARRTGKPVLFAEAGYRSATYAARWPADGSGGRDADQTAQADAYRALLATFADQPWWAGVIWWEWSTTVAPGDTSFSPRDKEAEAVLRRWYRDGQRR